MASQKIVSGNNYENKTSITIAYANSPSSNSLITNPIGPSVVSGPQDYALPGPRDGADTNECNSAGTFGYMAKNQYIIKGTSNKISGVANSVISSSAGDWGTRHSIPWSSGIQTAQILSTADFVYASGTYSNNPTISDDGFGRDDAANVSKTVAGEFCIMEGKGGGATLKDYRLPTA